MYIDTCTCIDENATYVRRVRFSICGTLALQLVNARMIHGLEVGSAVGVDCSWKSVTRAN